MKQKMVVKFTMKGQKSCSKALKIAASFLGVESASLKGDDKSQIEVTGDGVDPVQLTSLLRKSMGYAELVSVSVVDGAAKDENEEENKQEEKPAAYFCPCLSNPIYYVYEMPLYGYAQYNEPPCSIL